MRSTLIRAAFAATLTLSAGCIAASPVVYSATPRPGLAATEPMDRVEARSADPHVIVVSIDGLRPDAIERFGAAHLEALLEKGRYSFDARTILPSLTLPSHTSMITGVDPSIHGVNWNSNQVAAHGTVQVPTMFQLAREQGLLTAAFASKGKFNHLLVPGTVDYFVLPAGNGSWSSGRTAAEVDRYLRDHQPNLTFVHLREPDRYGHVFGWMGRVYGWAVRRADNALGEIIESADRAFGENGYTLIVTADHGGHGRTHGTDAHEDVTIPWIVAGKGVEGHGRTTAPIRTMDTAATALWLLGVPLPDAYGGHPVATVFDEGTRERLNGAVLVHHGDDAPVEGMPLRDSLAVPTRR